MACQTVSLATDGGVVRPECEAILIRTAIRLILLWLLLQRCGMSHEPTEFSRYEDYVDAHLDKEDIAQLQVLLCPALRITAGLLQDIEAARLILLLGYRFSPALLAAHNTVLLQGGGRPPLQRGFPPGPAVSACSKVWR